MRLYLGATDAISGLPHDQWIEYLTDGTFSISPYLSAGYTNVDVFAVGGGGGGGGGGTTDPSNDGAAGGGAGAGAGAFRKKLAVPLTSLDLVTPITVGLGGLGGTAIDGVGANVGDDGTRSHFGSLLTAYAGGGGVWGSNADSSIPLAEGESGGSGAGRNIDGSSASSFNINGPVIGAQGGGNSGVGGFYGDGSALRVATNGKPGKSFTDADDFGGGGGAGGGYGYIGYLFGPIDTGAKGGAGYDCPGSPPVDGASWEDTSNVFNFMYGGRGGGGGGGINLSSLLGRPLSLSNYGQGGSGGPGGICISSMSGGTRLGYDGSPGVQGVVLLRVYATA